jgi:hypothetical protein
VFYRRDRLRLREKADAFLRSGVAAGQDHFEGHYALQANMPGAVGPGHVRRPNKPGAYRPG